MATDRGVVPVASLKREGAAPSPHYIFEFTAGEMVCGAKVPRSSRTIVRFEHNALQRDESFIRASAERAADAGAGILCGFNEIPPQSAEEELDYAARVATAWRQGGLALIHLELGDFPTLALRDETLHCLLPLVTSVGTSRSELMHLRQEGEPLHTTAIRLAEAFELDRVCIHADKWAFAVTRGDVESELQALEMGCLLASTRAANGYFAVPDRLPDRAELLSPPLPPFHRTGAWSVACCPAPYLERPVATIGLGDTFLAGTLLVLGGRATPAPEHSVRQVRAIEPT